MIIPTVVSSGTLADTSFLETLAMASRADGPVILEVARDSGRRSFWFRDRRLVGLTTSNRAESLPAILLRRNKLQKTVADSVQQLADTEGITPAQVIMRDRVVPLPELVQEMNLWATLLVLETFGWEDADWRVIRETPDMMPPATLLELNLPAVMHKGVVKRVTGNEARGLLQPWAHKRPRHAAPLPNPLVEFDFDANEQTFWDSLDGDRTLSEILDFPSIDPDAAARLLLLMTHCRMLTYEVRGSVADAPSMAWDDDPDPKPDSSTVGSATSSGVDFSQIRFRRRDEDEDEDRAAVTSGTFHSITPGMREEVAPTTGVTDIGVGVGHSDGSVSNDVSPAGRGLDSLFDGLGLGAVDGPAQPRASRVAPPRRGERTAGSAAETEDPWAAPPSGADLQARPEVAEAADAPPPGAGPVIELEDWARLTTKDKERVRGLRRELVRMASTHYFEWFGLSHESPVGAIKKSYFQMAKLYHPDSLLDESDVYRSMAEALFSNYSIAYEALQDDESRDAYTRKHVFGEKDENDLALEKVQRILAAEAAFKKGLRSLTMGRLTEALPYFEEAVDGYEEEAEYVAYYGYTLFRTKLKSDPERAEEGMELLRRATKLKEMAPKPWHLLGKACLAQGDGANAKRYLRRSLKLNAENSEAVRDYRRADELTKSGGGGGGGGAGGDKSKAKGKGLFGGLFGGKKKKDETAEEDPFEGLDLDF